MTSRLLGRPLKRDIGHSLGMGVRPSNLILGLKNLTLAGKNLTLRTR